MNSNIIYLGYFLGIIVFTIVIALLVNRFFKRLIKKATEDLDNDPTNYVFLRHTIVAIIYLVGISAAIYIIPLLKTLAGSLLAGAGILAVAVGFASQHALSNIISGFFIIIFKPYRVNDRLKVRELSGIVEDISLRHTVIRDFENKRIIIPNSLISDEIIVNSDYTDGKVCRFIEVGISYESDIDKAREIILDEVLKHPLRIDNRNEDQIAEGVMEVPVRIIALREYSVNFRAWAWALNSPDGFIMYCDLMESIKKRFDKEGIEIPYPHRTLVTKDKTIQP